MTKYWDGHVHAVGSMKILVVNAEAGALPRIGAEIDGPLPGMYHTQAVVDVREADDGSKVPGACAWYRGCHCVARELLDDPPGRLDPDGPFASMPSLCDGRVRVGADPTMRLGEMAPRGSDGDEIRMNVSMADGLTLVMQPAEAPVAPGALAESWWALMPGRVRLSTRAGYFEWAAADVVAAIRAAAPLPHPSLPGQDGLSPEDVGWLARDCMSASDPA